MKLRDFMYRINEMVKQNPQILEYTVVAAKDAEGNGFNEVYYDPSLGFFENDEFMNNEEDLKDYEKTSDDFNSICIN